MMRDGTLPVSSDRSHGNPRVFTAPNPIALLADIHANWEALQAVLRELGHNCPRARVTVAGDILGYGPDPVECVRQLQRCRASCVKGNHDAVATGELPLRVLPAAAARAIRWQWPQLSPREREWIAHLPLVRRVADGVVMCHGDLDDPQRYLASKTCVSEAIAELPRRFERAWCLVAGHTHQPVVSLGDRWVTPRKGQAFRLPQDLVSFVNPGSVGQSRDGEALARYAIYDPAERQVSFHAVAYDHQTTCRKLAAARLRARVVFGSKVPRRIRFLRSG